MKRSFIREILEHTTNDTISFAGGLPDEKLFPNKKLENSAIRVLQNASTLQYSTSTGLKSLKEKIAQSYCDEGFETDPENIMITSGSQQALDIIARFYSGTSITIESPSYLGAMNVFNLNNIIQEDITLQNDGIELELFEKSLKKTKFCYLIPDFQNPTGYRYSTKKRDEVANIINQYDGVLIEDSPYTNLYFDKKSISISSMVPNNSFHLGSFSKTLAPALRIGWIRANTKLLEPLIAYKEAMDLHTSGLSQHILNDYLFCLDDYSSHIKKLRKSYKKKMQVFCSYLDDILPEFEYEKPKGGMFIYGKLPNIDTKILVQKCLEAGVVFVPGEEFYKHTNIKDEIRFNFTSVTAKQMEIGLILILQTIKGL
ncbi:MAG: PLP-dependent aminotransferase family protein [Campylobacterota bacterium]|nr:PLP-dependent aminotransferase family protein [Campylobacterota bacterium]